MASLPALTELPAHRLVRRLSRLRWFRTQAAIAPNAKGDYHSKEVGHDLFAVEELQSRIDDHGKDDVVEESPEDRQA